MRADPPASSPPHRDLRGGEHVGLELAGRHVDVPGQPHGEHPGGEEDDRGRAELPVEAEHRGDPGRDGARDPRGGQAEHRETRVGRRQRHRRRQHPGDHRGPQHVVRLRQHEDAERRGIEPEVVEVAHHHQRQDGAAQMAGRDRPAAAALQPVQRRPDHRGQDRERGHGHQQVERHVAALGVGARGEEQRAGQRDGDHRVAGHVQGVDPEQLGQPALPGPVGPAGRPHARRGGRRQLAGARHGHPGDRDLRLSVARGAVARRAVPPGPGRGRRG